MAGVVSFLGNQQCSHRDNNTDWGSNNNADGVVLEVGGSYADDLDNELPLLLLSCVNDDECYVVEVNELLVKDIANKLLECLPTLRQVRVGYVVPIISVILV